jgi:predicted transcriptional regulator of viral defense system
MSTRRKISVIDALERAYAAENRRIVSSWRAMIYLTKQTKDIPEAQRRWSRPPKSEPETLQLLRRLSRTGDLAPIPGIPNLFRLRSPFSFTAPVEEYEILMELNPYSAIAFASAFEFHGITEQLTRKLHCCIPADTSDDQYPIGTSPADWRFFRVTKGRRIDQIHKIPVVWHNLKNEYWEAGIEEYRPHGYPVRVTSLERTLLDGLRSPELCGGFDSVLKSFAQTSDYFNVEELVRLTDQLNIGVLRQRVGFLLDRLSIPFEARTRWLQQAVRGGSSKLCPDLPFVSRHDEQWCLSINFPIEALPGWTTG